MRLCLLAFLLPVLLSAAVPFPSVQAGPDGRLGAGWLPEGEPAQGVYRITFGSGSYFAERGTASFYPEITVTFEVSSPAEHYHVPLLLSPYGYTTYRGS